MKSLFVALTLMLQPFTMSLAHEGHDHGAPTFQPPKGGVLKPSLHGHFELVAKGPQIQIFACDKSGKARATGDFTVSAEVEWPRKKAEPLSLTDKSTHWEAQVTSKGAHRYTLKLKINDGKVNDYVKFTVENP